MRVGCAVLLGLCLATLVWADICTEDKLRGRYTQCDLNTDPPTRAVMFYYDTSSGCTAPTNVPSTIYGLDCYPECSPGEYLPWGQNECASCPEGTFSLGGGKRITHFEPLPGNEETDWSGIGVPGMLAFYTYCSSGDTILEGGADAPPCDGWRLATYSADTGDMSDIHFVNNVLEVDFLIQADVGNFVFKYMCDAESGGDGFRVQLDNGPVNQLANSVAFRKVSIPNLSPGLHRVRFIYYKDPETSVGEDIARIDDIEVYGLARYDDMCTPCSPGYYQDQMGQSLCEKCPSNSVTQLHGETECHECDLTEYAFAGTAECLEAERDCIYSDYTIYHTKCRSVNDQWMRTFYYDWVEPRTCAVTDYVELPPSYEEPCVVCDLGWYVDREGSLTSCERCPVGQYSDGSASKCQTCGEGTAALPLLVYEDWELWPDDMETDCVGDCLSDGWALAEDRLTVEHPLGLTVDVSFWLADVHIGAYGGSVTFEFSLQGGSLYSYLQFSVDDGVNHIYKQSESGERRTETIDLLPGTRSLSWNFHRYDLENKLPNSGASIYSIRITGASRGGAGSCTTCNPGTFASASGQDYCAPCESGHYASDEGSDKCKKCGKDKYAYGTGNVECIKCPSNFTTGDEGAEYCVPEECKFSSTDRVWDMSPLMDIGVGVDNGKDLDGAGQFQLSVCDRLTAGPCTGKSFVCEAFQVFNPYNRYLQSEQIGNLMTFGLIKDDPDINGRLAGGGQRLLRRAAEEQWEEAEAPLEEAELDFQEIDVPFQHPQLSHEQMARSAVRDPDANVAPDATGFVLYYTGGETDGCPAGDRTAKWIWSCDLGGKTKVALSDSTSCYTEFFTVSPLGCPLCTRSDFDVEEGECDSETGKRTLTYVRKKDSFCLGHYSKEEDCTTIEISIAPFAIFLLFAFIVVCLTIAGVVFLLRKNLKLKTQYSMLQQNQFPSGDVPEENVDFDDDVAPPSGKKKGSSRFSDDDDI